ARNEDEQQQQTEVKIDENPDNNSKVSETIKGKNKVIEQSYEDNTEDASTTESISFMSLKSQFTEKSSVNTSLSNISKHDSLDKMNTDETGPLVQAKWEIIKAQLFEVPREPRPAYREYQD